MRSLRRLFPVLAALILSVLTPALLLAQVVDTATKVVPPVVPATPDLLHQALAFLLPVVVGAIGFVAFQGLQKVAAFVNGLPAPAKQVLAGLISYILTAIAGVAGVKLSSTDIAGLNQADVSALISYLLMNVFHIQAQAKATAAVVASVPGATAPAK